MNSSDDDGENFENLACSVVSTSINAAKKKPTPMLDGEVQSYCAPISAGA